MAILTADRVQVGASLAEHPCLQHTHALEHAVRHAVRAVAVLTHGYTY